MDFRVSKKCLMVMMWSRAGVCVEKRAGSDRSVVERCGDGVENICGDGS